MNMLSSRALGLVQELQTCKDTKGLDEEALSFLQNIDEVRLVIGEALRARLTHIGKAPERGRSLPGYQLFAIGDEEIRRLLDLHATLSAKMRNNEPPTDEAA